MPSTAVALAPSASASLLDELIALLGAEHVLTEDGKRVFFSTDMASRGETVTCVIAPASTLEVSKAVALCTAHGQAVVPRGGGFSYTGGYRPTQAGTVMVDLRRLNRIVDINTEDMVVTVEVGVTWRALYEALKDKGLRTPYFGPMSGYWATVGGALSQGSFFLGSTQHGTVAESVLSLEVVLADGSVLNTGTNAGTIAPHPFYRWYGPDLSGLFLSDTGAMGFKTRASLRLIPWPKAQAYASFALESLSESVALVSAIGRAGVAAECYAWDPMFVKSVGQNSNLLQDIKYLKGVVGTGSSLFKGLKAAASMALAGKSIFEGNTYLVHVTMDDLSEAGAQGRLAIVREIAASLQASEVDAAAPRAARGTPFSDFKVSPLTASGVRNLPTNALMPHSRAQAVAAEVEAFFAERQALMAEHGIWHGVIAFAVGLNVLCIEPLVYWKDPQHALHDRKSERSQLDELARYDGLLPAAQAAAGIRKELTALFTRLGCAHVQIGKSYRWQETREPETLRVIQAIKQVLDPQGLVNPGSLGL